MIIEDKFKHQFQNKVAQVFLYIIDDCNLDCIQCLYKPELTFQLREKIIKYKTAVELMKSFFSLGAKKITFMGGEPTLHPNLPELIHKAKQIGYTYIRIDTNGQFSPEYLDNEFVKELDEITFSLDGYSPEINDPVRGVDSFDKCVANIKLAVEKNYETHITSCVHKKLVEDKEEVNGLIHMSNFAKKIGVKKLNMHDLLKSGIPRDIWSDGIATSITDYMKVFKEVFEYKEDEKEIAIRMPQCVTTKEEFNKNPVYYGYCSVKQYDRILAFPNGMLRICSLMIGTPYCVGYFDNEKIYWNNNPTNEILGHKMQSHTPCTNQSKSEHFGDKYPLCVSFKPKQDEPVWLNTLQWENKRVK